MKHLASRLGIPAALIAIAAPLAVAAQSAPPDAHSSAPAPASSSLNLKLPTSQNIPGTGDAPGVYYGDTGGKDGRQSHTTVHGSVSTMVGYSKGYGTGTATGVSLDVDHVTDSGNHVRMRLDMMQSDGMPGYGYGYGYGHGWPRHHWRPAAPPPDPH